MINEQKYKQLIAEVAANIDEAEVEVGQSRVKNKARKGISKVDFKNFRPDSQTATDAMNIVSRISREVEDFPTKAVVGRKFVNDDAKQGEMIVFRIDFETNPSFVATVKTNPSDLGADSSVNIDNLTGKRDQKEKEKKDKDKFLKKDLAYSRKGSVVKGDTTAGEKGFSVNIQVGDSKSKEVIMTLPQIKKLVPDFKLVKGEEQPLGKYDGFISLNSVTPVDTSKTSAPDYKDLKGNPIKTITKVAKSSQSPAIVRSVNEEEEQSFGAIKKRKSAPIVSAGFLGVEDSKNPTFDKGQRTFSKFQKLDTLDSLQQSTKDLISKFLRKLGSENIKETDTDNSKDMKKDFKQKIAEVAAKIAGINEKVDGEKLNLPTSYKTQANSAIAAPPDLAKLLLDIINELIAGETSMADIEKRTGWNMIMDRLKSMSGEKKAGGDVPPEVPTADQEKLPALQESFNRINRK
jgi:hypothetical protein